MSSSLSCGRSSVIDLASIDLPVPGSPIIIMCLRCSAALRITTEPASCPMTWSTNLSGIGTSSVVLKSILLTHSSIGVSFNSMFSDGSGLQTVTITSSSSETESASSEAVVSDTSSSVTIYPHTQSILGVWQTPWGFARSILQYSLLVLVAVIRPLLHCPACR